MRILIAEDNPATAAELAAALREAGYDAVQAAEESAARALLRQPEAPELAIVAWTLLQRDGRRLLRDVQAAASEPYLIVINPRQNLDDLVHAFDAGADDCLAAPFDRRELLARVEAGARARRRRGLVTERAYLRALLDHLPLTIYFKDRASRFTLINQALAERFGLSDPAQAVGKTDYDFFGAEHAAEAFADEQRIIRSGEPMVEKEERETWPDGRVSWVASTKLPLRGPGGEIVGTFGVSRDVTGRREGEAARRFLASIVQASDDAIIGVNPDGIVASWNRGAESLYGYRAPEAVGRSYALVIAPDRPGELHRIRDEIKGGENIRRLETVHVAKGGRRIDVSMTISPIRNAQGVTTGAAIVVHDVTARKRAEEDLYRSRQMLQLILDTIPQRVFWKDRNLLYLGCNKAFAADAGLEDPAAIAGKSDYELAWRESADLYRADDRRVVESQRPKLNFDEEQRRPDGSVSWLRTNKMPLRDRTGAVVGVLGTYEDITERKLAEQALRASEERYRLLFERNLAGVFRTAVDGRIVDCNESAARIFGYGSVGEVLGAQLRAQDLHYSEAQRQTFVERLLAEGRLSNYELQLRQREGHAVWVLANISLLRGGNADGSYIEGTIVDITDRKQAEAALAEEGSLAGLRAEIGAALTRGGSTRSALRECAEALVRRTGLVFARIWTVDPAAAVLVLEASAGLYTHINGAHGRVPVGHYKIGRIARDRRPHWSNDVQGDPEVSDHEWAKREGMVSFVGYPLVVEEQVVGVVAAFGRQPLTAAVHLAFSSVADQIARFVHGKRAQEALERSEAHSRLLFASIPNPALVFDLDTLRFLEVNQAAVEHYGYSREAFLRLRLVDLCPASHEHCPRIAELALAAGRTATSCKHQTRDGRIIDVEVNLHTLAYDGRRAALAIVQDVTERKKLEVDLRHAQKLEAVGGLAAGIAHEINTPIQFVGDNLRFLQDAFGSLSGLLEAYEKLGRAAAAGVVPALGDALRRAAEEADFEYLAEEIPKALSQSLDGVERVATIVRAMKEFAHPEQKEKAAANLNHALASTLVVARNELKYVADVETDFGDIPAVECHLGDLNQVFLNLLINAAHAVQDVVEGTGKRGTIRVRTRQEGDLVKIAISDTGCGIPEHIREKVFDPFFTTKAVGRGTGQGLAISRSIVVDKHRGTLTFESEVGRGTTFVIGLPIRGPAPE